MESEQYISKWHKELSIFCKIKPVIVLDGNVLDMYQYPEDGATMKGSILRLTDYLHYFFVDKGYKDIIAYDSLQGFYNSTNPEMVDSFAKLLGLSSSNHIIPASFKTAGKGTAPDIIKSALNQTESPVAIIMNMASRYIPSPDNLTQEEVDSFAAIINASLTSKDVKTENGILKNIVVFILNKINDIPAWFYLQNPNVKSINISTPSTEEREILVKQDNFKTFFDKEIFEQDIPLYDGNEKELEKIQDKFIGLTEGFSFTELNALRKLCKNEKLHIREMCDVVDLYRYGIKENPWRSLDLDEIRNAKGRFEERVKGQPYAQQKTLDIIKRAITGMGAIQGTAHGKPKGVLFFAGPTGTGKTETAKTLAELIFGTEDRCIRFDMSEYSQAHSDQKLLGAPPGYVGYEAGGQLTNAVRENPFSILLFDEIEKAHPSIFDKFLQILEDGRMTDGQGRTVYFSECIIIFTSNLGIYSVDQFGERQKNVNIDMTYEEVSNKVRSKIEDYFKLELGRPEILNRIGDNIVVFDYIRPEIADMILVSQINKIIKGLKVEKQIELSISDHAKSILSEKAHENLENGGRGIGNVVESMFINPLSRYLFDNDIFENANISISNITVDSNIVSLVGTHSKRENN